ncbi:MAG: hypothetical protein Q7S32_00990 [bacterium]|nr:hypothetical protein [bacterium]
MASEEAIKSKKSSQASKIEMETLRELLPVPILKGLIGKVMSCSEDMLVSKVKAISENIILWWNGILTDAAKTSADGIIQVGIFLLPCDIEDEWWKDIWALHKAGLNELIDNHDRFVVLHCFLSNTRTYLDICGEIHLPNGGVIFNNGMGEKYYRWNGNHNVKSQRVH